MPQAQPDPPQAPLKRRRTQEERSNATREALLDATIECLVDYGYAGTTTTRVAERAGLSRGAPMHHYQRKAPLVVAALLHLASKRRRELVERAQRELPSTSVREGDGAAKAADPVAAAVELLWSTFSGPLFTAAIELWIAARTDDELREALMPVEREIGQGARRTAQRLYEHAGIEDDEVRRRIAPAVEMTGNAMRGMALQQLLDPNHARLDRQLSFLKEILTTYLTSTKRERPIP
jgi:AcrR family transcriptional regulator